MAGQAGPLPTPAQPSPSVAGVGHAPPSAAEACPLCGSPLEREQDWCLRCGAAARTRLSATPNWKAPLAALIAVAAVLLGVLAAALIALAHGPGPAPVTRTVIVVPGAGFLFQRKSFTSPFFVQCSVPPFQVTVDPSAMRFSMRDVT